MQPCSFRGSWACSWSLCGEYYIRFASSRASDAELLTLYGFFSFRKAAIVEDEKEVAVAARTPACATTGRAGALATRATRVSSGTAGAHCFVLNAQSLATPRQRLGSPVISSSPSYAYRTSPAPAEDIRVFLLPNISASYCG